MPGYVEKKEKYLELAQAFVALDDQRKAECVPRGSSFTGWTCGAEAFNGKRDSFKCSYYATLGDQPEKLMSNVWPSSSWTLADEFKSAYLDLAHLIFETGRGILPMLELNFGNLSAVGRMLYYGPVPEGKDDGNPYWCGVHRDHGLFTGLIPSFYKKDGSFVPEPDGVGLHIRDREVNVPNDVIMFQVGEAADLLTNQGIIATDHGVKKAYGGYERYSFALFFAIDDDTRIYADRVDSQYQSRFKNGMTYGEWCKASLERYAYNNTNP
ncbi:MAG: 2OG-Fe(II) oxygenase family protein [Bacteroidota bacterium]